MFFLYHHYDSERLAGLLEVLLGRRQRSHALAGDTVIVPNHGVGRWLQILLAESVGIAANIDMPLPARFIWERIPDCLPAAPDSADFQRERMRWHIYGILPELSRKCPEIAHYLEGGSRETLRLQLAGRLAGLFDQYLIYRPQLLYEWEQGNGRDASPERWQAPVWRALTEKLGTEHRARLLHRFIDRANQPGGLDTARLPSAVYCFALDALPPEYVKFLYALGQHIDVHFLLPNPSAAYWGDIQSRRVRLGTAADEALLPGETSAEQGHPLLASLGRAARDQLRVLYSEELHAIQEPELGWPLAYDPPAGENLLARVRKGIIAMQAPAGSEGMQAEDASVQIHACHGPLREVQVLHDQLLDLLSRNATLQSRHIVVMTPDINTYAPMIRSVFGSASGNRRIPFSVSDTGRDTSHPIVQSFSKLMDLPLSRWPASEILSLAAVPALMRRFGLDESALETARQWVEAAGVRWGFDRETRAAFGAAPINQNTWRFGFDRLLLGLAQSDEGTLVDGVAPWSELEGGSTAALGRLWHLVERLHDWSLRLQEEAGAARWQERLNALLDDLFRPDRNAPDEQAAIADIREALTVFADAAGCLGEEPLPWRVARETLGDALGQSGARQPLLSGGVTFCGMNALPGVPFRVVCLLGMDDGAFPRQEANRNLNLLRQHPRLGDHNIRDDDRLIFLQSLMAARDVFYISYTGQDVNGGETRPPSPLVGEWQDFLKEHYFHDHERAEFEARLVTRQPMHPFSPQLFRPEPAHPRLFTFESAWQPATLAGNRARGRAPHFVDTTPPTEPPDDGDEVIDLSSLRAFFDHPAKFFFQRRLQVTFDELGEETGDEEPLDLGRLTGAQVRSELFADARERNLETVPDEPGALWQARGELPPAPLDAGPFADEAGRVNVLLPVWRDWTAGGAQPDWRDLDLTLGEHRLVGRLNSVWPDGPRSFRTGKVKLRHRLRCWIDFLAWRSNGGEGGLRLAGLKDDRNADTAIEYTATIPPEQAREHLEELLALYRQGQREPLLFTPELAEIYLQEKEKKEKAQRLNKVNARLSTDYQLHYQSRDNYLRLLYREGSPLGATPGETAFCELAESICQPVLQCLTPAEDET